MGALGQFWQIITHEPLALPRRLFEIEKDLRYGAMLEETFVYQQYYPMLKDIRPNTVVIDIGAFMGETAIYFAQNPNVKKVIALEPMPSTYEMGKKVLAKANPEIRERIDYRMEMVGSENKSVPVSADKVGWGDAKVGNDDKSDNTLNVRMRTLDSITKGIKERIALKIDCEGYEGDVLRNADLKNVYAVIVESSKENKPIILKKMKVSGFRQQGGLAYGVPYYFKKG